MTPDRTEIARIVEEVLKRYTSKDALQDIPASRGIFSSMDDAVNAARDAQKKWMALSVEKRAEGIAAMRATALENARHLAEMAVAETGYGRVEDKYNKNVLQARKTPGIEDLEPVIWTGDRGLTLVERAPFGVVASVTPSTNPGATIINNSISLLSAGNSVVFSPHPAARKICHRAIELLNQAIERAGGPANLITALENPTLEASQQLMKHPGVRLLVVTGGPSVVKQAMASGKRAIAAGPGNPPVVVCDTADLVRAARDTLAGHAFDNNIMCTCEKEVFVADRAFREFVDTIEKMGAYRMTSHQLDMLMKLLFKPAAPGERVTIDRSFTGKPPQHIAKAAGFDVPPEVRTLMAVDVPKDHPLVQIEQLMPVLPIVRTRTTEEAVDQAIEAEHGYCHTAVMHSRNIEALSAMAYRVCVSLFVKNGPNYASLGFGGEGPTTMTIAGTTGEGVTSARVFTRPKRCALVELFRIV